MMTVHISGEEQNYFLEIVKQPVDTEFVRTPVTRKSWSIVLSDILNSRANDSLLLLRQ